MLDVLSDGDVAPELGSNAQLREAFGTGAWGPKVALAVRMLQLGSPAIVVGVGGYDTHSNELAAFPSLARDLGRQLAALRFVLARLDHPKGGTYGDRTVVGVLSEFSRDNTEPLTGYNSANGSDHRGRPGSRYQALPVMGPGVQGGRLIGSTDPDTMESTDWERVYSSQALLASFLDLLGIDPTDIFPAAPIAKVFGA